MPDVFAVKVRKKGEARYRFLASVRGETSHRWADAVNFGRQIDAQTMIDNCVAANPDLEFRIAKRPERR